MWRTRIVGQGEEAPDQLVANPYNFRVHPAGQQAALMGSLDTLGWIQQVVVNRRTGHVIDGHLRVQLALANGEEKVPVLYVDLSEEEERLALLSLDPIAALAGTDRDQLKAALEGLRVADERLAQFLSDLARRERLDLAAGVDGDGVAGENIAEELRQKWGVEYGQLWSIPSRTTKGEHRLMCADATDSDAVAVLLQGNRPFIMVTDPPYGVAYDPDWRDGVVGDFGAGAREKNAVANDDKADWADAFRLFPGVVAYVWHAGKYAADVAKQLERCGFEIRAQIIWRKQHYAISRGNYHWQHEPCWYAVRRGHSSRWCGDRSQSTVWDIASLNPAGRKEERLPHATQKPIECMARPIRNHGAAGDIVYDPFAGSGTTIVAAEQERRLARAMDIEPRYVAIALERLARMGLKPQVCVRD